MCFGGGKSSAATIVMPKTDDYDRQFEMQKAAMEAQMRNGAQLMQQQLQSSLQRKRDLMDRIAKMQTDKAMNPEDIGEMVDERVQTIMSAAKGLNPSSNAQMVKMGREKGASRESDVDRSGGGAKRSGKDGLRIRRNAPKDSAGVGLSITSGD